MRNRRSYIIILFAGLAILILGCEKQKYQEDITTSLSGIWIEQINGNDTIDFEYWDSDKDVLFVKRGFEIRNDYWLPKYGSGPYQYSLKTDTIMLFYMISSAWDYHHYFFQINSSMSLFEIGNFYDTLLPSDRHIKFYKVQ